MSFKESCRRAALASCAAVLLASCPASAWAQGSGWVGGARGLPGKDLNAVYFVDSDRGWVAGDGGLVLHTRDGGRNWARQTVATKASLNDVYFRNKKEGYLIAGSEIFNTGDGGENWRAVWRYNPQTNGGEVPELYSVRFTSNKRGWVVGSLTRGESVVDSFVLVTDNGGDTWQRQHVPVHGELIHLDFDGRRGWVVGSGGRILHTRNGGESWTEQVSGTTAALYHVDFEGDEHGWIVGERGTILRTDDGGRSWHTVRPPPVRSTLLSVKFVSKEEGWVIGRNGVILRTEDGGGTWKEQTMNVRPRPHLYALFFRDDVGWAVGGGGIILRYER